VRTGYLNGLEIRDLALRVVEVLAGARVGFR
jgi:hypothetical protein